MTANWTKDLTRQCLTRSGVVIHGNTGDLVRDPDAPAGWVPVPQYVTDTLQRIGYRRVVRWDQVGGITNVTASQWADLSDRAAGPGEQQGEEYPLGDAAPAAGTEDRRTGVGTDDVLGVVDAALRLPPPEPTAFVLDWTEYLFGEPNSLSEKERRWLTRLGRATREAPVHPLMTGGLRPLVVLLCSGNTVLPPALYLNNPTWAVIQVSRPDRQARRDAVLHLGSKLRVEPQPSPGSRTLSDLVDSLDGLTTRDVFNLAALSQREPGLTCESLVSLYRYGERISPWEQLNRDKLQDITGSLGARVKGQDQAIDAVRMVLLRAYSGLSGLTHSQKQRTPKGVLFFVGPTGVGKTELAKALANFLFGDDDACIRFDMSEYNHEHADQRLVGAPPGYVGFEQGGQLTNAVRARPFSVLLFDEIEKAHGRILDKFLQILEDGRLTDGRGETVQFSDTVIVFTSNIGAAEVPRDSHDVAGAFVAKVREHFIGTLRRPELLGRIGEPNIVPFGFVDDQGFLVEIARTKLEPVRQRLREKWGIRDLRFVNEDAALTAIAGQVDPASGGRGALTALGQHIVDPLSEFLFLEFSSPQDAEGCTVLVEQGGRLPVFSFRVVT